MGFKRAGGIVDIEFLAQYLVLRFANQQAVLLRYPDNMRILDLLEATQIIPVEQATILRSTYCTLRDRLHELNLAQQPGIVAAQECTGVRQKISVTIWNYWLNDTKKLQLEN